MPVLGGLVGLWAASKAPIVGWVIAMLIYTAIVWLVG